MAMKKIEPGPLGLNVARNVRQLREQAGYGYAELSRLLTDMGRPIPPLGLRHLEAGERRVDVDDLWALAFALNTAPITLLLPVNRPDLAKANFLMGPKLSVPQVLVTQARAAGEAFSDGNDQ